jgi:hypothetical protein
MVILPFPDKPASREIIVIDEVSYSLILTWNERSQGWTFGLEDRDGNTLISGRRIVLNIDLLGGFHHLAIPTGPLLAIDQTGNLDSISKDDMILGRVALQYLTEAEFSGL